MTVCPGLNSSVSDAMTLYQTRPFFLAYISEWYLNEPMNLIQKIASGE